MGLVDTGAVVSLSDSKVWDSIKPLNDVCVYVL